MPRPTECAVVGTGIPDGPGVVQSIYLVGAAPSTSLVGGQTTQKGGLLALPYIIYNRYSSNRKKKPQPFGCGHYVGITYLPG